VLLPHLHHGSGDNDKWSVHRLNYMHSSRNIPVRKYRYAHRHLRFFNPPPRGRQPENWLTFKPLRFFFFYVLPWSNSEKRIMFKKLLIGCIFSFVFNSYFIPKNPGGWDMPIKSRPAAGSQGSAYACKISSLTRIAVVQRLLQGPVLQNFIKLHLLLK
jgi:hypothetical protein